MNTTTRTVVLGALASAAATMSKTKAEQMLQPLSEKLAPPSPAEKIEIGADPAGHPENMPPSELADRAAQAVNGSELSDEQRLKVAAPLHWGMGMGFGIAYSLLAKRVPAVRAGYGLAAGGALLAATHGSTLPAAGLQHPLWKLPAAWWGWEGGSHLVYGAVLDMSLRVLDRIAPPA